MGFSYAEKITKVGIPRSVRRYPDDPLDETQKSIYISLVQQLAWLARTSMPSISFEVSRAQQRANKATIHDLMAINGIIKKTEFLVANKIGIVFRRKEYLGLPLVVGIHDASFAQEEGLRSQRGYNWSAM